MRINDTKVKQEWLWVDEESDSQRIMQEHDISLTNKWYILKSDTVHEKGMHKSLSDFDIQIVHLIQARNQIQF